MEKILFIFSFMLCVLFGLNNIAFGADYGMMVQKEPPPKKPPIDSFEHIPQAGSGCSCANNAYNCSCNQPVFFYKPSWRVIRVDKHRKPINPEGETLNGTPIQAPPPPPHEQKRFTKSCNVNLILKS